MVVHSTAAATDAYELIVPVQRLPTLRGVLVTSCDGSANAAAVSARSARRVFWVNMVERKPRVMGLRGMLLAVDSRLSIQILYHRTREQDSRCRLWPDRRKVTERGHMHVYETAGGGRETRLRRIPSMRELNVMPPFPVSIEVSHPRIIRSVNT